VLLSRLRAAPITAPTILAVVVFLAWVPLDGGQAVTRWSPGAIALIGLLGLAAFALPFSWRTQPAAVRVAVALLAAFTAWSYLSIAWADDGGVALEGANRTLLYLVAFALFALWPQRPATAAWVLGLWTFGVGIIALVTLIRIGVVDDLGVVFDGDRLVEPAGYANADAATFLMPFWAAVAFAASARVPFVLRGAAATLAVVMLDVALLCQSRGSVLSLPVCALAMIAFVPGRLRHIAAFVPVLGAAALALPKVVDLGDALDTPNVAAQQDAAGAVLRWVLIGAIVAGAIVVAVGAWESRRPLAAPAAARVRRAWTGIVVACAVVGAVGGLIAIGNPVHRVDNAWHSFKAGYDDTTGTGNHITSGLGSNRYDFFRVALDVFDDHPIPGAGADNFFQDYLQRGTSDETPRYPHNLVLRTLEQTGLVGTLLLAGAFLFALVAALTAMRAGGDPLAATVAGGATLAFAYWVAHGMTDWFWEWAGLGAPAFALLGLACALAPRRAAVAAGATDAADADPGPSRRRPAAALVLVGAVLVVGALVIAGPWLAERDVEQAGKVFTTRPFEAYSRLDRAADLDPVSDRPALIKGSIALRYGDLARARTAFEDALDRNPRGEYATLELGAIASVQGHRPRARRLLDRAVQLAPRDATAREAAAIVGKGGTVDLDVLNARLLSAGQALASG
jgi:O-antigen ligase/polysaccharide polymerase Wzy-like membrane protein